MTVDIQSKTKTFKEHELQGWDAKASSYDDYAGEITRTAVQSLLSAAHVKSGTKLLDIASGPGYITGTANEQGAIATGVDFSPAMVKEAGKNYPKVDFHVGDAEALQFNDETYDAVTCAFGLLHLADPDKAISEAFRVLRPGGRYAFTVWCSLESHEYFNLVFNAIETHGTTDVPLPPAPPIFRFSEPNECERVLSSVGFTDIAVEELPLIWKPKSSKDLLGLLEKSSVRTAMLLDLQTSDARQRIYQAIIDGADKFKKENIYQLAWPAIMAVGKKAV